MVFFVLKGGEYALRYLRYKQLSRKIVKMSLVDKELRNISANERMFRLKIHKELFENKRFQCYPFYFFTYEIFSG